MATASKTPRSIKNLVSEIARDLQPNRLIPSITAGMIVGLVEIIVTISLVALIYSGELSSYLAIGIGFALIGAIITGVTVALFTSLAGIVSGNQEAPAAIVAVMAVAIVSSMPSEATSEETFLTVVVSIALTTLLTGIFLLGLGHFKLGGLVRFLPYPVVGGFLAGTGWLLVTGSISTMTDISPSISGLAVLFQPGTLIRWLPGLIFALAMLVVLNHFDHFLLLPGLVVGGIVFFYLAVWLTGSSITEVRSQGWLLGPFPDQGLWQPLRISAFTHVDWRLVLGQAGNLTTVLVISAVALLLNASGLELIIKQDMDLNYELRTAGIANLIAGLLAGIVGFHQLGLSTMNHKLGAGSRLTGLFTAGVCLLALTTGTSFLSFFPKIVLGSLIIFLGLSFLYEWVYDTWFKLPKADYLVILLILVVTATVGFLEGVLVGILAAVILFVINYSRVDVIKHTLTADSYHGTITHPQPQRRLLSRLGKQVYILELQGYIFFGTANLLLDQIQEQLNLHAGSRPRYVILDFSRVTGIDSSVVLTFRKLGQTAQSYHARVVLTGLSPEVTTYLEKAGVLNKEQNTFITTPDLDQGVEWCGTQLLESSGLISRDTRRTVETQLRDMFGDTQYIARIMKYLEKQELPAGAQFIHQGDSAGAVYFVEEGIVTAQLESPDEKPRRLQTLRGENLVGELGFYLGSKRNASVVTDAPTTLYRLSVEALKKMELEDPEAATLFHKYIAHLMAEKLSHLMSTLETLTR